MVFSVLNIVGAPVVRLFAGTGQLHHALFTNLTSNFPGVLKSIVLLHLLVKFPGDYESQKMKNAVKHMQNITTHKINKNQKLKPVCHIGRPILRTGVKFPPGTTAIY